MSDIAERTLAWIEADPDRETRAELTSLLNADGFEELERRMDGTLEFGTAGLRAEVAAGSNRMNRATVIRATAGLSEYLASTTKPDDRLVVIGRDARPSSSAFMDDAVGVLAAAGFRVRYFEEPTPTPLVAFAGLSAHACASIVITASHNPRADNGYKVYARNGVQIVPPADADIARAIAAVGPANEVPRTLAPYTQRDVVAIGPELFDDYLRLVSSSLPEPKGGRDLSIVYTPLHGVGGRFVVEALRRFGFRNVRPVARQFAPDGTFPTVAFPNPEEPGVLDLAHELAEATDTDLIIANDPDTDRLAISIPTPGGVWRDLTGNQIGCLLAQFLLERRDPGAGFLVNSIVSTPMLGEIAKAYGATWHQSLTGFKWIWNAALTLEQEEKGDFVMGFEEALGYSIGTTVRDKDGISSAIAFAALAAEAAEDDAIVLDRLADLYRLYGIWVSTQISIWRDGPEGRSDISLAMQRLRADPPAMLGDVPIVMTKDFSSGASERPWYLGETNLVELDLGEAGRVLARPSGTEPKLKIYVDLKTAFPESSSWLDEEQVLVERARRVGTALAFWLEGDMGMSEPKGEMSR